MLGEPRTRGLVANSIRVALGAALVALLVGLLSGRTPGEVVALDVDELFERLQLAENLSPNRHFGIYAIVGLMKSQAARLEDTGYSAVG